MSWKRARSPEQKAKRRQDILDAARALFAELEYEEISLNGIAREAGISKPNIYRYWTTREEIFLAIYAKERRRFVRALVRRLNKLPANPGVEPLCSAWVTTALEHRSWLDLLPHLPLSMEKNASVEQIVAFKLAASKDFAAIIEALVRICPQLGAEKWIAVVRCAYALMAGLWPLSQPAENVLEALEHPDVEETLWDFETLLTEGFEGLLRGALSESRS